MGNSVVPAVGASAALALSLAPCAMASNIEFGKSKDIDVCAPSEMAALGNRYLVSLDESKAHGSAAKVDDCDGEGDYGFITVRAVGFGKSRISAKWASYDWDTMEVVSEASDENAAVVTCTKASIPKKKCDKVFDGVEYTAKKLCAQRDSGQKQKLWKALSGYRFTKGSGYEVLRGGKSIRFSKGGKNVRVHLKKGSVKPTVTVGVVHSRDAEYRYITKDLAKSSRVLSKHYSKGECEVIIRGSYHGVSMNVMAWTWYKDGKRQYMQWLA